VNKQDIMTPSHAGIFMPIRRAKVAQQVDRAMAGRASKSEVAELRAEIADLKADLAQLKKARGL
jgi:hypothetical protein